MAKYIGPAKPLLPWDNATAEEILQDIKNAKLKAREDFYTKPYNHSFAESVQVQLRQAYENSKGAESLYDQLLGKPSVGEEALLKFADKLSHEEQQRNNFLAGWMVVTEDFALASTLLNQEVTPFDTKATQVVLISQAISECLDWVTEMQEHDDPEWVMTVHRWVDIESHPGKGVWVSIVAYPVPFTIESV